MATRRSVPPLSAVLPLPPMEYDVAYMNSLIRVLAFLNQQLQRQGPIKTNQLTVEDRDGDTRFLANPQELTEILTLVATNLPTSATGLVKGQIWVDTSVGNVLKIVP